VAAAAGGSVSFTTDVPDKKGRSDEAQTFNLTLHNDTPQQLTFTLNAQGGPGTEDWKIEAVPSGQAQAASFTVDAGATQGVTVTVTPGTGAASNKYPIVVDAVSGSQTAEQQLTVEITGNVTLGLGAQEGKPLSTTANAGSGSEYTLVVSNTGTSPATNVTVTGSGPTNWKITFDGQASFKLDSLAAGATQNVVATITPTSEAIAGDYVVTFNGASAESSKSVDVRVTVETSPLWGIVSIAIIVLVIAGLLYVFQRYGRR
jgi:uncharacterized membrane protein